MLHSVRPSSLTRGAQGFGKPFRHQVGPRLTIRCCQDSGSAGAFHGCWVGSRLRVHTAIMVIAVTPIIRPVLIPKLHHQRGRSRRAAVEAQVRTTEAASALLGPLRQASPRRRVVAECRAENSASWHVREKLGFRPWPAVIFLDLHRRGFSRAKQ